MAKQELRAKTIQELRKMAKTKGLVARRDWKKKDFIKALSSKKVSGGQVAKPVKGNQVKKTAAKKRAVSKTAKKPAGHTAPQSVKPLAELGLHPLPAEYHDDRIVSMPVTPGRLYVYWEIPENKIIENKGSLNIKALDMNTNSFFYTPVSGRIGESFIAINPDSDYSIEIGVINSQGEFVNISQVGSISGIPEVHTWTPTDGPAEDIPSCKQPETTGQAPQGALPEEFFKTPGSINSSY